MDGAVSASLVELIERERDRGRIEPRVPVEIAVQAMSALGDGLFMRRVLDPHFDPKSIIPAMMAMIGALLAPAPGSKRAGEKSGEAKQHGL